MRAAGRGRASSTRASSTTSARGKPALIVYDVKFAEPDTREGFPFGGDTWSGAESDKALADTIRKAGNVILLADATFVGETTGEQSWTDPGFGSTAPDVLERRVIFRAVAGAGRRRQRRSATTFSSSIPTDRSGTRCRSSEPATARCRRSVWRRRCGLRESIPRASAWTARC